MSEYTHASDAFDRIVGQTFASMLEFDSFMSASEDWVDWSDWWPVVEFDGDAVTIVDLYDGTACDPAYHKRYNVRDDYVTERS